MEQRKSASIKQLGEDGAIEAVIATLGVVDHDGDVVAAGALAGKVAYVVPAHQQYQVPIGKVTATEDGDKVIAVGKLFLDVAAGKDWHAALKADMESPPPVQEWSWGYAPVAFSEEQRDGKRVRILEDVDLHEVSPVLRGASIGTRTVGVKSGMRLAEQIEQAAQEVESALKRVIEAKAAREQRGRDLSDDTVALALSLAGRADELLRNAESLAKMVELIRPDDAVSRALSEWAVQQAKAALRRA